MRLLVIEDDDRGASYLVRGLQESGHVVDRAQEGETGLMLATEGFYDVAVIDRMLPRMDGIAIVQAMRKVHWTRPRAFVPAATTTSPSLTPSPN